MCSTCVKVGGRHCTECKPLTRAFLCPSVQSEQYVEYNPDGTIAKGMEKAIPKSKYSEDGELVVCCCLCEVRQLSALLPGQFSRQIWTDELFSFLCFQCSRTTTDVSGALSTRMASGATRAVSSCSGTPTAQCPSRGDANEPTYLLFVHLCNSIGRSAGVLSTSLPATNTNYMLTDVLLWSEANHV